MPLQITTPGWTAAVLVFPVVDAPRSTTLPPRVVNTLLTLVAMFAVQGPRARPVAVAATVPEPLALPAGSPASLASDAPPPMTMSPPTAKEQVLAEEFQPVQIVLVASMSIFPSPLASESAQKTTSPPAVLMSTPAMVETAPSALRIMRPVLPVTARSLFTLTLPPKKLMFPLTV